MGHRFGHSPIQVVHCMLCTAWIGIGNVLYNKVFSIIIIHRKKEGKRESGRMVVTKSGKTGRESAVFLVTTWRKIEKTLLYSILFLTFVTQLLLGRRPWKAELWIC